MRWPYVSDGDLACLADDVGGQGRIFLLSPFDLILLARSRNLGFFGELGWGSLVSSDVSVVIPS